MHNDIIQLLARLVVLGLGLMMPVLAVVFTDRFRKRMEPQQYMSLFILGALAGIFLFIPAITIVAACALLALGIARVYAHYALEGLSYERTITPSRLFPGEEAALTIELKNMKLLPLAWISISDPIQYGLMGPADVFTDLLHFSGGVELLDTLGHALVNRTAVAPYGSVKRTYGVRGLRRGFYTFGPAGIESSDPFGLFNQSETIGTRADLIVYPHVYTPEEIGLPFREVLGEVVTRRSLYQDPTLLAGSREYVPGDPLHRMHWKATARTGDMQVRVSDPSTTAQLMVVTNLNTYQHLWQGVDLHRTEAAIDVTASLCVWALDRGYAVGVRSNGVIPGSEMSPRVAPSAHPRQATSILEHLAHLSFSGRHAAEDVLAEEARRLASGSTIVFITPIITPQLVALLTSRKLRGRVSVVYCGRFAAPLIRGLPVYLARPPHVSQRAVS